MIRSHGGPGLPGLEWTRYLDGGMVRFVLDQVRATRRGLPADGNLAELATVAYCLPWPAEPMALALAPDAGTTWTVFAGPASGAETRPRSAQLRMTITPTRGPDRCSQPRPSARVCIA